MASWLAGGWYWLASRMLAGGFVWLENVYLVVLAGLGNWLASSIGWLVVLAGCWYWLASTGLCSTSIRIFLQVGSLASWFNYFDSTGVC